MAKRKVPKGTQNMDCIGLLPDDLYLEFAEAYGTRPKGDMEAQAWGDAQLADLEYYKYKLDKHIVANAAMTHAINGHTAKKNAKWHGVRGILVPDRYEGMSFVSVESRTQAVKGKLGTLLADMLDKYRPMHLGFSRDRQGIRNVVREVFGKSTGDQEAAQYAAAWGKMSEYVRKRLNAAGARIGKLDDWGMPQYHDPGKVSKVSRDEWISFINNKLDWIRMSDDTGLPAADLQKLLRDQIYDNIITDGASKIDLGRISGKSQGTGLLTRLRQHRFMHFKDGDAWLEYQDMFGTDDYMTAMDNWMQQQSTNISLMETLGPNPEIGYQHLRNLLMTSDQSQHLAKLEDIYKNVSGNIGTSNNRVASIFSGLRSFNVVRHLGNATLSMLTDPAFLVMTAKVNEVPVFKTLMRQLKLSVQQGLGQSGDLKFAAQLGYVSEYATDRLLAAARLTDVAPHAFMARLSEISVRASWMHAITVAGRAAFALEYSASLAKDAGKTFLELSPYRKAAFERVGIDAFDWDRIRSAPTMQKRGVDYVDVNNVGQGYGKETSVKLAALIQQEMNMAVPTPGAETRAWQNQGLERGTFKGELLRSLMEFKSFPITLLMLHGRRALHSNSMNRYAYGGTLAALLLGMGWVATSAKDISKGHDPVGLTDEDGNPNWKQLGRVAFQSGALGIYGDMIFQDQTRFGQDMVGTMAGPTFGLGKDTVGLVQQGTFAAYESLVEDGYEDEEADEFKNRIAQFINVHKPELWQIRALENRALFDGLNTLTDGDWERKQRRSAKTRRKELGQTQFWADDQALPERMPQLSKP